VLDVREALAAQSFVLPPVRVRRGDAQAGLARAPHRLSGQFEVGGQEHFYLEGQIAYVLPQEQNQWLVYSSTQHPGEAQHWVAHALGVDNHRVRVECRRMGGGFGGKETQSGHLAVWAAIAANKFQVPGQAAPGPRRRLHDHRQAPPVCLRLHRRLRRHRA
jgi:xanthine dehydrogenase large subunit